MPDLPLAFIQTITPTGARLRVVRQLRRLGQRELEVRAGLPATALSHIENGRRAPDAATQARLALALDVDVAVLFDGGAR